MHIFSRSGTVGGRAAMVLYNRWGKETREVAEGSGSRTHERPLEAGSTGFEGQPHHRERIPSGADIAFPGDAAQPADRGNACKSRGCSAEFGFRQAGLPDDRSERLRLHVVGQAMRRDRNHLHLAIHDATVDFMARRSLPMKGKAILLKDGNDLPEVHVREPYSRGSAYHSRRAAWSVESG